MDKLVIYTSTQTHSLGLKAGLILGLPVYTIPVRPEDNYSLRGQDLREAIENGIAEGKHPFVISETPSPLSHARNGLSKSLPQLVLLEPLRAVQSITSMKLRRPVSPGEL